MSSSSSKLLSEFPEDGTSIGHGVIINAASKIGSHCILNSKSLIFGKSYGLILNKKDNFVKVYNCIALYKSISFHKNVKEYKQIKMNHSS